MIDKEKKHAHEHKNEYKNEIQEKDTDNISDEKSDVEINEKDNINNANNNINEDSMNNGNKNENKTEKNKKSDLIKELLKEEKEKLIDDYINVAFESEKLKAQLIEKDKECLTSIDKYKRALADLENLRKRTILDKQEALKYSNFNIINDLIFVLDDFQRAIDSAKTDEKIDLKQFLNGIEMIEKHFADLLFKKYGVLRYGEKNEDFDPKIHKALMLEDGDFEKEIIMEVFRMGYLLHDRVIRPAEVKIGRPKQ